MSEQPKISADGRSYWAGDHWAPLPTQPFSGKAIILAFLIAVGAFVLWVGGVILIGAAWLAANAPKDANGFPLPVEPDPAALGQQITLGVPVAIALGFWYWWTHRRPSPLK